MDELQKLYDVLVREGKYTKSFEEFQSKWSQDQAYKDKVYDVVSRDGLYTKDKNSFFQKFSAPTPVVEQVSKKKAITELPSEDISLALPKVEEEPKEEDYFTGAFGSVLKGLDSFVPLGIGDFVDDMARSVAVGYKQGTLAEEADKLLLAGSKATPEQIQKFIDANKDAQKLGPSAEMQNYQKIYEGEGKGFWGVVKGLANNPSIIPEVLTSSITAMATNTDALKAGAAAVGTGTTYGAGTGALAGGVGAVPGAVAGAVASVPYAFGLASSVVEMGSTFGELLQEELKGKEMTKENVKAILENPDKLNDIRNKAIARGAIIGTVDAFTGKLASGVGAKIISKSAAKSATGAVTKGAATAATAAGAGIEAVGGSLGEATARGAIGQEMDVSEIALEGLAELPGGIRSTIQARLAKPEYKINGAKATADQVDEIINTMSPADLAKTKIDIKNDYQGREFKIQDKIVTNSIKEQVRQGNPELNEPSLNAITELEKDLKKLEGNTTQTGKDKAAAIRGQIKNIQENQLQEEAKVETIQAQAPELVQKRVERITALETILSPESTTPVPLAEKTKLEAELQTLKTEQDAFQKQTTDESVLRIEQPEMGLQQMGEGNVQPEVVTTGTEETITPEGTEEVVSSKTRVNVAPFFNTRIETVQEAEQLRQEPAYQEYKQRLNDLATQLGLTGMKVDDVIGGFKNEQGDDFVEISNQITFDNATLDQAEEFAAMAATIAPEVQEASIAAKYVNEGEETHNANEYRFKVDNVDSAMKALKQAGISNFSINETDGVVTFTDVFDFADEQLQEKMGRFAELLDENNISYEQQQYKPTESRYVDKGKRKEIIRRIKSQRTGPQQRGEGIGATIEQSIQRDAEFQGTTPEEYEGVKPKGPAAGNRLFNEPIKAVKAIADRYYKRAFGTERPNFEGTRKLDKERAKRLSDAFIAMKHAPNNKKVREAYNALAKEAIDQYQAFLDAGYVVEINNQEPYANSQEMIDDLRNNKRIKIFSTESGFGDNPITDKQRKENPLLATTEFKDVNDQPLLVNDLFRAVHDFFGHSELGNAFGPLGEENAWQVHARMFSPLARQAMTTETRGQNSYVNFSGVNEKAAEIREKSKKLREEGKYEEALKLTDEIYENTSFADQKVGLLPEEFYTLDEEEAVVEPVAEEVVVEEEEQYQPIKSDDIKIDRFNKSEAIDYEEGERESESGRITPYLSSVTVQALDADGEAIGTITKVTDEDKIFYFTAQDIDGNDINLDGYETLGDAKKAIADSYNKIKKKEFAKEAKKKAKEKAKVEAKKAKVKAKAKAAVEPTVEEVTEEVAGTLDELLELDPNDETTLKKVSGALAQALKDIEKFERENLGVNIALPLMKTIIKAIKLLVDGGVALQDAIKRVAKDNNVTNRDIVNGINSVTQIAPIQAEYDAIMVKADELIARQKKRGITEAKIISNLDTFIRNSEVYKNANDAQKKIMEREARVKMGVGPKRAISIGRVLGALKDITNISREEKMLVIKQIRELSRDAAKELAKEIREMASTGKITAIQAANIISRFGRVNMLNEISVSNFVDYMAKVFANAEYAAKIDVAKSKLKIAKKNIVSKIGIADGLVGPLQRLFSVNPTIIPDAYLERYLELVDMFGARQAVLTLDEKATVTKEVEAILKEIDNEQSKADELADRFNNSENKVFKDDELDYAASVKKMLDEKEIDDKEAETMRKYKEDIAPQVEESELTQEEIDQEKQELIAALRSTKIDGSELPSQDERNLAKNLSDLIKTDGVQKLTNTELKNLLKIIDNINNNYLPHYTELMVEKINSINKGSTLAAAIERAKVAPFSRLYSRLKAALVRSEKTSMFEMIRRNPLFYVDQLFGDFKTKDIFNSVLEGASQGAANFKSGLNKIQNLLENAEEKVAKSFKLDPNKTLMSKFKMMTYMVQLEYQSNQGNKQVNPASEYLKATIKHIDAGKSNFGERDATMLQEILDKYSDAEGNIDNDKLYNSFNEAEKNALNVIRGINESLREKAEYTAAIIRGDRITPLNNYVHLNVLHEHQPNDLTTGSAFVTEYNNSLRPSTKAKSLIARTGKVSPLNFDVFASAQRGAKFVLMDYNLTEPIRTARKTVNQATALLEGKGRIPKQKRQIINAINNALEESIEELLTNSFVQTSLIDNAIDYVSKQGYRAVLAGTGRFISELTSNVAFALISDPSSFITGTKYKGVIMSNDAPLVMQNLKSKQTNRIFPTDTLSGRFIDTSILSQASGIKGGKSKNIVANKIQQIWNLSGKKYVNVVELSADALISTPDKIIMRPMWFGSFANEFKKITGSDVDFEKIAANDEAYMKSNEEALKESTKIADERSVYTGATDNPFMGILKGTVKQNQSPTIKAFNNFNNFMTKFLIFEYVTARTGLMAAVGNGSLTKRQGAALLAAASTRMVVYGLLVQMLGTGIMGLMFDDEDEPENEKSFMQKLGQAFASAFSSLLIGRDFGNSVKTVLNYGIEEMNEKYLDFLREGEYDPYKDGIAYSIIPRDDRKNDDLGKLLMNMGGSFTPALNTAALIYKNKEAIAFGTTKKEADAIQREQKTTGVRIPLEVLGNLGLVPLYKDIRKVVMEDINGNLNKASKAKPKPETYNDKVEALRELKDITEDEDEQKIIRKKIQELQASPEQKKKYEEANKREAAKKKRLLYDSESGERYDNESELKRYNPSLYRENFGPGSDWYEDHKAEKDVDKKITKQIRKMEDVEYEYTAPSKSKKNADGSTRRSSGSSSSFRVIRRDAFGNVISSFKRTND